MALLGSAWLLLVLGLSTAAGYGASGGADGFGRIVGAAVVQAPAVWLVGALALLGYAFRSTWTYVGWAVLVLFLLLGQIGELLSLPDAVIGLSPYSHVPRMPVEDFALAPTVVLTALALALGSLAWLAYRVRDIGYESAPGVSPTRTRSR